MISLFSFMIILLPGYVQCQGFNLEYSASYKTMTFQSEHVSFRTEWVSPSFKPTVSGDKWEHISRTVDFFMLSGIPGQMTTDLFINQDIEIERQVWT